MYEINLQPLHCMNIYCSMFIAGSLIEHETVRQPSLVHPVIVTCCRVYTDADCHDPRYDIVQSNSSPP